MIRFSLHCEKSHGFDAWFRNNEDFEKQLETGFICCPVCGSPTVHKALMAPAVSTSRKHEQVGMGLNGEQKRILETMRKMAKKIRQNADYVGDRFADEARKIHFGEVDPRAIYGEVSMEDVSDLLDDGVDIMPLPELPEDKN